MVHNVRFTQRIGLKKRKNIYYKRMILDRFQREFTYVQSKIRDQSVHCVNDRYMAKI